MNILKQEEKIKGVSVKCFKQNETNILCKINITPSDAMLICNRNKNLKNIKFCKQLINVLSSQLEGIIKNGK